MNCNYKRTITRSFSEKVPDGNYGNKDFFSCHSLEIPAEATENEISVVSQDLFNRAYKEVQESIEEIKYKGLEPKEKNGEKFVTADKETIKEILHYD